MRGRESAAHRKNTIVSLFSGCGGMDLGFLGGFRFHGKRYRRLPNEVVFANDVSEAACRTYRENIGGHIREGCIESLMHALPESCDILSGGFPCQDVSVNGKRQAGKGKRTILYHFMVEAIKRLRPAVFIAENVRGLLACGFGRQVLSDFEIDGYTVAARVCLAADYGVPQNRERLIIVGVRGAAPFRFPGSAARKRLTAREAVRDLEGRCEDPGIKHLWSKAKATPEQGSRKLRADAPATTMRAEHHGNVQWHYALPRRISLREQARFQSFPDEFTFPCGMRETERQIGNAVPPVMAWHLARAIQNQVFASPLKYHPRTSLPRRKPADCYPQAA